MSSQAELIVKRQREISFRSKNSASWNQAFTRYRMNQVSFIYIDIVSYLGADHLIFFWGGGGGGRFRLCNNFFPTRGTRQILFSCKSAAQDIFPQYISRQNIFFSLSYSYRQRRSWGFQSEEAENWIPRGAKELSLCFILYRYVLMFPTLKRAGLLTKNV
jgi:hypothetical protein